MPIKSEVAGSEGDIGAFWKWFQAHQRELELLLNSGRTTELTKTINLQIDKLSPQIAWEIGPGLVQQYMLVFPAEGDKRRRAVIGNIVERAPRIDGWEFHTSRPCRSFKSKVELPESGLTFQTSDWKFRLGKSYEIDRLDLTIFDDHLATFERKTALITAFILLDAVLGEDIVERWISNITVLPFPSEQEDLFPMCMIAEQVANLAAR